MGCHTTMAGFKVYMQMLVVASLFFSLALLLCFFSLAAPSTQLGILPIEDTGFDLLVGNRKDATRIQSAYCLLTRFIFSPLNTMASLTSLFLAALTATASASVQDPKISPRPPMGFNNWARFMCNLNETLFTKTADAMVDKGLLAAGYNNINLDDCWSLKKRNAKKELEWDPALFPHGLPWLGEYLHKRGFNFGLYTNSGNVRDS